MPRRGIGAAGAGDPAAQGKPPYPGNAVRRVGLHCRDELQAGEPDLRGQRRRGGDDITSAQLRGHPGEGRDQLAGRNPPEELVAEMLSQLADARRHPASGIGVPEPVNHPPQLRQHMASLAGLSLNELLERLPARLAMLPRDGQLSLIQRGELSGGQAAFRLQLQVPQAWPAGQRARRAGHDILSRASGGAVSRSGHALRRLHHLVVGGVDRGRAAGDWHEPDVHHRRRHPVP